VFNFDVATNLPDLGSNLGFSFHDYCLIGVIGGAPAACPEAEGLVFDNADAHAESTGDSLLLSEFGATDDLETLDRITGYADDHMVSWQEWHYCGCDDPTTSGPGDLQALVKDPAEPPTGDNVFRDKLEALARPYPQVIAGTPERFSFDPASKRFEFAYSPRRVGGDGRFRSGRTLVFLPKIQYPGGYRAKVRGGSIEGASKGRRLVLRAGRGSDRVALTVTPR
jgi:endoglycosylceramidase